MAERALAGDETVDDRRIGLQPHVLAQPVDEHAGDPRALVGLAGLLLDDGGERDHVVGRAQRQVGARRAQICSTSLRSASCMRTITAARVSPR